MICPAPTTIRDFVLGIHPSDIDSEVRADEEDLRNHVMGCADCARILADEAALDEALFRARGLDAGCACCGRAVDPSATALRCTWCGASIEAGPWRIVGKIAENDRGRMYAAVDSEGRRVALKELVFRMVPDLASLDAFAREGALLRAIDHPGVPNFVDAFKLGEGVETRGYLAQELVVGRSLADEGKERLLREDELLDVAEQVLDVLVLLQSTSPPVFHRDIKPANLMRRTDGSIAVVDFGVARAHGATQNATLVGTFGFMPTEQLTGIVDRSTDVYALGASLAVLATRRPPWEVVDARRGLVAQDLPPRLGALLTKMCAARPEDRFADAAQTLTAVRAARRTGPPATARRRGALWGGGAALALALVVVPAGAYLAVRTEPAPVVIVAPPSLPLPPRPPVPPVVRRGDDDGTLDPGMSRANPSTAELLAPLKAKTDAFMSCARRLASPEGTATLKFSVGPQGAAQDTTYTGAGVSAELSRCMTDVVASLEFPVSGTRKHVSVPFRTKGPSRTIELDDGASSAPDALGRNEILIAVKAALPSIQLCRNVATGVVKVRWRVAPAGDVIDASIVSLDEPSLIAGPCVLDAVRRIKFPATTGTQPSSMITFPFRLDPPP